MIFRKPTPIRFSWHKVKPDYDGWKHSEADIQSYIVLKLRDWLQDEPGAFLFHADQGGIRVNPQTARKAKALGLEQGVPDIFVMLRGHRLVCIELKAYRGSVSREQKNRHELMATLGFPVHVVKARSPADCWQQVIAILHGYGV